MQSARDFATQQKYLQKNGILLAVAKELASDCLHTSGIPPFERFNPLNHLRTFCLP